MSEIKKKFAKSAILYQEFMKEGFSVAGPAPILLAAAIGGIVGAGGTFIVDKVKPLEKEPQLGQEEALQQYKTLLEQTKQKHGELKVVKISSAFVPDTLSNLLNLPKEMIDKKSDASKLQSAYNQSLNSFVTSALVDKRLNEADIEKIMLEFEKEHGSVKDVTSFSYPIDYNDISESRKIVGSDNSEYTTAQAINRVAAGTNEENAFLQIGGGITALPFLLMLLIASSRRKLNNWADGRTAPKKIRKNNH